MDNILLNGKKNIGVFFNCSEVRFQKRFCRALANTARKKDYNLLFFIAFEVIDDESDFNKMNEKVIKFAPIENLDAVIIAYDTFDRPEIRQMLEDEIRSRATCPVISFREKYKDFLSILSNANDAIVNLVNHLADCHNCKNIMFMAGYPAHYDSNERLEKYKLAMEQKGLPIYENSVFHADMWRFKGEEAFQYFFSDPEHIPDAVICANDYMARALCTVAIDHGLRIPEDLKVTGVDDISEAIEYHPTLTTVSVDIEVMAECAIDLADKLIRKVYVKTPNSVPAKIMYRESCGCNGEEVIETHQQQLNQYYERVSHLLGQPHNQTMLQIDLDSSDSMEELLDTIQKHINLVVNHKSLFICLSGHKNSNNGRIFEEDITDEVEPVFGYRDGKRINFNTKVFNKSNLLTFEAFDDDKPRTLYFSLLHDSTRCFGFVVSEFESLSDTVDQYYFDWILKLSLAFNKLFIASELRYLLAQTQQKSLTDFMTNISNRRSFDLWMNKNLDEWIKSGQELVFMTIDVDGLKKINDAYGHETGDMAIKMVADIIRKYCPENGHCSRMGGDEFLIVYPASDIKAKKMASKLERHVEEKSKEEAVKFELEVSIGWYQSALTKESDVERCLSESDSRMYEVKKKHHAS